MKRKHNKKDKLSVIVNLRMTPELFKKIDKLAGYKGVSMSYYIREFLEVCVNGGEKV